MPRITASACLYLRRGSPVNRAYWSDSFGDFFEAATGNRPYPYQKRLAGGGIPSVIKVQTGAGKTEAAVLSVWLWRRLGNGDVPRRLIYCLPRRTLVEQTVDRVRGWLRNLDLNDRISVALLMGGSRDDDFEKYPTRECVIVGTQDMLISGALNRAYGQNPYRWPITFGMLNNDCMWVMDEIQLMENALPTSVQLDAFRQSFGTFGSCRTIWMSATIDPKWLRTVDSPPEHGPQCHLTDRDYNDPALGRRRDAPKRLRRAQIDMTKGYDRKSAGYLMGLHRKGTVTAIMVNTVKRSQDLYDAFRKEGADCMLVHSRFRAAEREKLNRWVNNMDGGGDKIVITTQVLEAGVDISVRTLVTELAPWSSLVQRFGRCNRRGEMEDADVYWIDIPDENYAPYGKAEMEEARRRLCGLDNGSVSPRHLSDPDEPNAFDAVLRRRDVVDLFDTTADLSGNHTDASRFVRTIRRPLDVGVFWRDSDKESAPDRNEICNVPVGDLKDLLRKAKTRGRVWNHADGRWQEISAGEIFPGQTVMLDSTAGGYSTVRGWDKGSGGRVDVVGNARTANDSHDADSQSLSSKPVTLEDHTAHVLGESRAILNGLAFLGDDLRNAVTEAVRYHDIGKAHAVFQSTMMRGMIDQVDQGKVWAKSQKDGIRHNIPGFRHEAASALAYLAHADQQAGHLRDLVAYLIASHHGKVRLALRNISGKRHDGPYLLGINTDGDRLPKFTSGTVSVDDTDLRMDIAQIGMTGAGPSWVERAVSLLERYGPFRLAYLELLVRASDMLASGKEREDGG